MNNSGAVAVGIFVENVIFVRLWAHIRKIAGVL